MLNWPVLSGGINDALALRLTGACHALARAGAPIATCYPPNALPTEPQFHAALATLLESHQAFLLDYLKSPPQTNEVMRSAVLMSGLMVIAQRTRLPLALFELGASAGLNLAADAYFYQWGDARWGDPASPVHLVPEWRGAAFPAASAPLAVASRRAVDQAPVDISSSTARERLISYVWPDQPARLQRMQAAMDIASRAGVKVETGDAIDWLTDQVDDRGAAQQCRVIYHSFFAQYLSAHDQERLAARIHAMAPHATPDAPLAWLRFESELPLALHPRLRLTLWPGGEEKVLAAAHPHGAWMEWRGT